MFASALLVAALTVAQAPVVKTASTATTARHRYDGPAVAIFPAYTPPLVAGRSTVDEQRVRAFGAQLATAAGKVFAWRRWTIVPDTELADAIEATTVDGPCQDDLCYARIGHRVGATHAMIASLIAPREGTCRARVAYYDLASAALLEHVDRVIAPCSDDNLLAVSSQIGQTLADGPRAPVRVTLNLTSRTIPVLDIPDVEEVPRYIVETSTRTDRVFELERALEIYEQQHMFVFDSDDGDTYYIARGGRLLSECDARRVASAPRPDAMTEFCDGNDWEWAWLGVPFGGLVMLGSSSSFDDGGFVGVVGMGIGGIVAIASAAVAIALNVDAKDPRDGEYYSVRAEVEAIVKSANEKLREQLDLTEAEVLVAGMRL